MSPKNQREAFPDLLVIVAHPDDESIWFGGTLNRLKDHFRLHILCLTHARNETRAAEFRKSCEFLNADPHLLDCEDGGNARFPRLEPHLDAYLAEKRLPPESIASVITHSPAGEEHWHSLHIQLHWQVAAWCRKKNLDFGFFASHPGVSAFSPILSWEIPVNSIWRTQPKKFLLLECFRIARSLWNYGSHETLKIAADREFKQALLAIYDAQSLRGYAAYTSPFEFLFTRNPDLILSLRKYRIE